jgi:hypothetical protein
MVMVIFYIFLNYFALKQILELYLSIVYQITENCKSFISSKTYFLQKKTILENLYHWS